MTDVITEVTELPTEAKRFALFSGGNDSLASTHYSMQKYDIDFVVYLDTNTGLPENREFVERVCEQYDWPLAVLMSPVTLKEFALGTEDRQAIGFPSPKIHSWAYEYFKERQLRAITTHVDETPKFYTGVRKHESKRRMKTVEGEVQKAERWVWVAPLHDWRDEQVDDYRREHDLPINPVVENIGRSGDCYCGAYAHRDTELAELEAHYPDHAEWIMELESTIQDELGTDEGYTYWGFGGLSGKELRAKMAQDDANQMSLCSSCDVPIMEGEDE